MGKARTRAQANEGIGDLLGDAELWHSFGTKSCAVAAALAVLALAGCGGSDADEQTIALARQAYEQAKASGVDMARGPCLGVIKPGWVADVAHDPRQAVDDDPANQCPQYRTGDADHFVELDPDGEFIRSG